MAGWLAAGDGRAGLTVNGRRTGGRLEPGTYTTVTRHWRTGDRVELVLPRVPVWRPAPDNPQVKAVSYGPLVLAGAYGDTPLTTLPAVRPDTLRRTPGEPTRFTAVADGRRIPLRPFHEIHHQRYNVYWSVTPPSPTAGDVARYPSTKDTAPRWRTAPGRSATAPWPAARPGAPATTARR